MSKDHFYFSRNDKIVALILLFVIVVRECPVGYYPCDPTEN